jgi:hypothetical protein
LAPKKPFLQETAQNKEKRILLFDLRILFAFQLYFKYCKVPKSLDSTERVILVKVLKLCLELSDKIGPLPVIL